MRLTRGRAGTRQSRTLKLTNVGDGPLVVQAVTTTCGCTEVDFSSEPVRPGQQRELTVSYDADERGFLNKVISIYTNAQDAPYKVRVTGNERNN